MTILLVGFVVVALALVTVVASAASVYLDRTRLAALADLAALDAADALSDGAYYARQGAGGAPGDSAPGDGVSGDSVPGDAGGPMSADADGPVLIAAGGPASADADAPVLTDADVGAAVDAYLRGHPDPAAHWDEVRVLAATSPDGRTARVRLAAVTRPAMLSWVLRPWADGIAIEASASARAW